MRGVAGNCNAGRGRRTVASAAIGAGAGLLIDKAEDRGRTRGECEAYLKDYEARYSQSPAGYGNVRGGYGRGGECYMPMMIVPVVQLQRSALECTETVEYVYEGVPVRPTRRIVPQRRVRIVPVKRVPIK
jgi:hypothetical protein